MHVSEAMNTDYLTELSALYEISSIPTSLISHEELGRLVLDKATRLLGASTALLYRREGDDQPLQFWATRGVPVAEVEDLSPEGEAIARALDEGQPVTLEGVDAVRALGVLPANYSAPQGLCLPIRVGASVKGLLCALRLTDHPFSRADLALFNVLADRTGTALETMRLFAETERRYRELQQEITERRRAEETLRESEELYRTLVETSPDAISLSDLDTTILVSNQRSAALLGFETVEEIIGKRSTDFFAPEDRQRAMDNARRTLEEGIVRGVEYTFVRKDGTRFPGELSASLIADAQGKPKAFMALIRDITERKRAEEELAKTMSNLQRFNRLAVGRELQMIELKREVNDLLRSIGRQEKYRIPTLENDKNQRGR